MGFVAQNAIDMQIKTRDTDDSNVLEIVWNENEAAANRTLNVKVNADDRTIDLTGNLTVEAASTINQDLSSDALGVAFGSVQLGGAGGTVAEFSTDGTMGDNSDTAVPTEKAVVTYVTGLGGMPWTAISDDANAVVNNGYIVDAHADRVILSLPATAVVGSKVGILGGGNANGWQISAAAGDTIQMGDLVTKAAGALQSTDQHDSVLLVCTVADSAWKVIHSIGTINVETS